MLLNAYPMQSVWSEWFLSFPLFILWFLTVFTVHVPRDFGEVRHVRIILFNVGMVSVLSPYVRYMVLVSFSPSDRDF